MKRGRQSQPRLLLSPTQKTSSDFVAAPKATPKATPKTTPRTTPRTTLKPRMPARVRARVCGYRNPAQDYSFAAAPPSALVSSNRRLRVDGSEIL